MDPRLPQHDYSKLGLTGESSSASSQRPTPSQAASSSAPANAALAQGSAAVDWSSTQAARADVLKCYEEAVQEPLIECTNIDSLYASAQLDDTARPEARLLREDFCSTAVVARTWLSLRPENRSQGVDIDLQALLDTRRRLYAQESSEVREQVRLQLIQSPAYAAQHVGRVLPLGQAELQAAKEADAASKSRQEVQSAKPAPEAKAPGADGATDRFERRHQARLAKERKFKQRQLDEQERARSKTAGAAVPEAGESSKSPRMTLVHSDVLDLPFSYAVDPAVAGGSSPPEPDAPAVEPPASSSDVQTVAAPDVIAAMNYALCYFHTRAALLAYLRVCLRTLRARTGVLICDLFGGPPTGEAYPDQAAAWRAFEREPGFRRRGDKVRELEAGGDEDALRPLWRMEEHNARLAREALKEGAGRERRAAGGEEGEGETDPADLPVPPTAEVRVLSSAPPDSHLNTCAEWPKGKLKLVRKGKMSGGFEYWREDGPIDYMTNRFRMSLSFRFKDRSWLRDMFSYDFRIWSLAEIIEGMEEVGFVRVKAHVVPRNATDKEDKMPSNGRGGGSTDEGRASDEEEEEMDNMTDLLMRTEVEEASASLYKTVGPGGKVFATASFSSYIVACAP